MKKYTGKKVLYSLILLQAISTGIQAQEKKWNLDECINYALEKNISIQQSKLNVASDEINLEQSKSNLLPTVNASVASGLSWSKDYNTTTASYDPMENSASNSYGLNASATLFNGFKLKTRIEQAGVNLEASEYYADYVQESIELSILDAYLQILYASEELENATEQVAATEEQLKLAKERMELGIISNADYLQINAELATEKLTMVNAKNTLAMAKVNLMQLMEMPVNGDFDVVKPDIESLVGTELNVDAGEIYMEAVLNKPQVKEAELNVQSVMLDKQIAKADLYPSLTLSSGVSTAWSNSSGISTGYTDQLLNKIVPTVSLNLSIPIFQKNQVKNNLKLADISVTAAKLTETDTKNSLRKEIEQACIDYLNSRSRFEAGQYSYEAVEESYQVAEEKYRLGLMNSVDYLLEKTKLIQSESEVLQSKYNVLFAMKILDYYAGKEITFTI